MSQPDVNRPLKIREFAALVGVSYNTAYRAIKRGEIESSRIGRQILVPRRVVNQILEGAK